MRTFLRALAALIAVLLVPGVSAAVSVTSAFGAFHAPGPERAVPAAAPIQHDPAKPTAVVVVGELGAVISDVLAPYEILASTGRFNVYTVAARRVLVPLTGGLDLVPDLTFDDPLARTPDLVVVPALPDVEQPITDWLRMQSARGAQMLAVCNGAGVLASAGLLDGRRATAHWLRLNRFEANYPKVNWVRGARYVDDGTLVSTGGILSSVDGTLHMIERLAGPTVAANAAAAVRWRHYRADPPVSSGLALPDVVAIFNGGYRWNPAAVGVLLTDGVGEIELASVFEPHSQSLAARTYALSTDGGPVRSRHGLTFVPRGDAPELDRLLVPGSARGIAPILGAPAPEYVHDSGFAFDATLRDLARNTDVATARWTAKVLELPTNGLVLDGPGWPWGPTLLPVALILLGVAVVLYSVMPMPPALPGRRRSFA